MSRLSGEGRLSGAGALGASPLSDAAERDPMESMGNLMDVMLVFICGLLLALIAHWNVDITSASQPAAAPTPESATVSELESELEEAGESELSDTTSAFSEYGTVYQDEETGELYLVMP